MHVFSCKLIDEHVYGLYKGSHWRKEELTLSNPLLAVAQHTSLSAEDPSSPQCKVCTSVIIVKQLPWTKDVWFSHSFHNSQLVEGSPWREKCLHKTFFFSSKLLFFSTQRKDWSHISRKLFSFFFLLSSACHTFLSMSYSPVRFSIKQITKTWPHCSTD